MPRRSRPEVDAGERPLKGFVRVSEIIVLLSSGTFATGLLGYLRYRSYTKLMRHVVDKLGVEGLQAAGPITPPVRSLPPLPRRRQQVPARKPARDGGSIHAA